MMAMLTEQQKQAVITTDKHVLVSAGAGSGKTHVLVERYLELLRNDAGLKVSNIIAVTYTRKAATEMRTRLKARLNELVELAPGEEKQRFNRHLSELDSARIGTIHSLCESILKKFSIEAAINPQFEVLNDLMTAELIDLSINEALHQAVAEDGHDHALLFDFQLSDIRKWLRQALKSSMRFFESLKSIPYDDDAAFAAYVENNICQWQTQKLRALIADADWQKALSFCRADFANDITGALEKLRLELLASVSMLADIVGSAGHSLPNDIVAQAWGRGQSIATFKIGNSGGNSEAAKALRQSMRDITTLAKESLEDLPIFDSADNQRSLKAIRAVIKLVQRAHLIYTRQKMESLTLDYDDLIQLTLQTLQKTPSDRRIERDIKAILVDEFQDTNLTQSSLLSLLAGEETKFFFIGDAKQSIYRFQGADIAAFKHWHEQFSNSRQASVISLNTSFRSHIDIVTFINAVCSTLMQSTESDKCKQANFEYLQASSLEKSETPRIELVVFQGESEWNNRDAHDSLSAEAESVADWIAEKTISGASILDKKTATYRNLQYSDIAVLVQRNRDFAHIEKKLSQRQIPYVLMAGRGFLKRQEVLDIENLLRFLSCQSDSHSLMGVLRSPLFGLPDNLMHAIGSKDNKRTNYNLWSDLQAFAGADSPDSALRDSRSPGSGLTDREKVKACVLQLKKLIIDASLLPLADLLQKIIVVTQYDLVLLAMPNGKQRSRNLWKLVNMASTAADIDIRKFVLNLERMRKLQVKQFDAPIAGENAVKLMTIHTAKGLEFPAVLLPVLNAASVSSKDSVIYSREYGIAFNYVRKKGDEKPCWYQAAKMFDDQMEIAERKRLFYVAATRCRDYLAFFVDKDGKKKDTFGNWLCNSLSFDAKNFADDYQERTVYDGMNQATYAIRSARHITDHLQINGKPNAQLRPNSLNLDQANAACAQPDFSTNSDRAKSIYIELQSDSMISDQVKFADVKTDFSFIEPLTFDLELPAELPETSRLTGGSKPLAIAPTVLGTYFHAMMVRFRPEHKMKREELEVAIFNQNLIIPGKENLDYVIDRVELLLEKFYQSDLYTLLVKAKRRIHEYPYLCLIGNETKVRRPDLIFQSDHGKWHVVDFKTDHFDLSAIDQQSRQHIKQLQMYTTELKKMLNIDFRSCIYYAQYGILHECNLA